MARISAHEHPILRVFSDEYAFEIPSYQRPYRWGIDQAEQLYTDLLESAREARPFLQRRAEVMQHMSPYFLGAIVVIKGEGEPNAQVVDGQQRLTTLSLLMAALRSLLPDAEAQDLTGLLLERGSPIKGTQDRCRLTLREKDHAFFQRNILENPSLVGLESMRAGQLSEPQRNLTANLCLFRSLIEGISPAERSDLATFLLQHTYLVVVGTESFDSAFRIFSVLNDRGLDLSTADILKADVIGMIPAARVDEYTRKWEDAEERLGAADFDKLISHIVMLHNRQKTRESVLKTFRAKVRGAERPIGFIDEELLPYAEAFATIQGSDWEGERHEAEINRALRFLNRLDNSDWIPPALMLIHKLKDDSGALATTLNGLERLAVVLWLNRATINERIDRYGKVMAAIDVMGQGDPFHLAASEIAEAISVLNGDIYHLSPKPKRTLILLRLDEALSAGEARYQASQITVEHVLPQNPNAGSNWLTWWPDDEERSNATHRLGNLALLNRRQNAAAKNWDFEQKKLKYFRTIGGASPFVITNEVLGKTEWTPAVFQERQQKFVDALIRAWSLTDE